MKKLISLILVLITLFALCVPAMAEEEPYETISYVYSTSGGSEHFSFYSNRQDSLENAWVAGDGNWYFKLFAKNRSGLKIKDIELRYVSGDFANAGISCGTKVDPEKSYQRGDWLRINNIHSKVFIIGDHGSPYKSFAFDEIRVYYEDAEIIEEDHEIIYYDFGSKSYSENFCLDCNDTGFLCWITSDYDTIYSTNKNYQIKRLEIFLYSDKRPENAITVSHGTVREAGAAVKAGNVVHIDDIHSPSVSFIANKYGYCCYSTDVIVYYEPSGTASVLSEGNGTIAVGIAAAAVAVAAVVMIAKKKKAAKE